MDAAQFWDEALSLDDYVGQMWRKNRKTARNREQTVIDAATRDRFAQHPLRILILTEHYCEDSLQLVPVIWRLADEVEPVAVRVLRQHQVPELASRYQTAGHPAIPVFIVLNRDGHELGALRRPSASTRSPPNSGAFSRRNPNLPGIQRTLDRMPDETRVAVKQHIANWREHQLTRWADILLEDLDSIANQ